MLTCSDCFLVYLQPSSFDIEGVNTKNIYTGNAFIRGICVKNTSINDAYITNICIKNSYARIENLIS